MADTSAAESSMAPKPKKKSVFSTDAIAPITSGAKALDFFSRGRDTFERKLEEDQRKQERKVARLERKRSSKSADLKENEPWEEKRRKVSVQKVAERGYSSEEGSRYEDDPVSPPLKRRESSHTSPEGRKPSKPAQRPQKPATSLSARYSRELNAQKSEESRNVRSYVSLSDSDNDEEDKPTKKVTNLPVRKTTNTEFIISDDEDDIFGIAAPRNPAPKKPASILDEEDDDLGFSVEFPEFVQAAREREKQKAQQRLEAAAKAAKETSGLEDDNLDDLFESSDAAADPIVEILISSKMEDTKPVMVKRKLSQRLKEAKHGWCDKQNMPGHSQEEFRNQVFLTWRNHKLHDATTSRSLGVSVGEDGQLTFADGMNLEGRIHLLAWTESAFEIYQSREADKARKEEAFKEGKVEEAPAVVKIKLILKAKNMSDFKLTARPATSIEKILAAFRNAKKDLITDDQVLSAYFDGEKLDPESTVEDADMEDMDTIDVTFK